MNFYIFIIFYNSLVLSKDIKCRWYDFIEILKYKNIMNESVGKSFSILEKFNMKLVNSIKENKYEYSIETVESRLLSITLQLAFIDLLNAIGIVPNSIIDCTMGQIAGAYCDGCIDRQQALHIAYYIARFRITASSANKLYKNFKINKLISLLQLIIGRPRQFSCKMIFSYQVNSPMNYGSSQYFIKTLSSPIDLKHALARLPSNSILIGISPSDFLPDIVDTKNISFFNGNKFTFENLLSAIGQLYCTGLNPKFQVLYPSVSYPVSRGTLPLSPMIGWDHSIDWFVPTYPDYFKSNNNVVTIDQNNPDDAHHWGHVFNGKSTMTTVSYLLIVWKILSDNYGKTINEFPIEFENIKVHCEIDLNASSKHKFYVELLNHSGQFEIFNDGRICVTGSVKQLAGSYFISWNIDHNEFDDDQFHLNYKQIQTEFQMRNYYFDKNLLTLKQIRIDGTEGVIDYHGDLFAFICGAFSMKIFCDWSRNPKILSGFKRMRLDPTIIANEYENKLIIYQNKMKNIIYTKNMIVEGIESPSLPKKFINDWPKIESFRFFANKQRLIFGKTHIQAGYLNKNKLLKNIEIHLQIFKDIIMEKTNSKCFEVKYIKSKNSLLSVIIRKIFIENFAKIYSKENSETNILIYQNINNLGKIKNDSFENVLNEMKNFENYYMIILIKSFDHHISEKLNQTIKLLCEVAIHDLSLLLYEKLDFKSSVHHLINFTQFPDSMVCFDKLRDILCKNRLHPQCLSIELISQNSYNDGLIGMVNCLKKEIDHKLVRCSLFNVRHSKITNDDISNKLNISVLNNGRLGTYKHTPIDNFMDDTMILTERAQLTVEIPGNKYSTKWTIIKNNKIRGSNSINIYYCALNFRDLKLIKSKIVDVVSNRDRMSDNTLGFEFSGRDGSGNRVMGIVRYNALSSYLLTRYCK